MRCFIAIAALLVTVESIAIALFVGDAEGSTYRRIPQSLPGSALDDATVISLERGPCFGRCPEYTVTVYGSGRVEFAGRRFVCAPGRHTARASPDLVRVLVEEMLAAGYLDFHWRAGSIPTISTTVVSSLSYGGRMRRIEHHAGDTEAPRLLTPLEDRIDVVAGTWRWLPELEDDRRVCRREDGETELFETFVPPR